MFALEFVRYRIPAAHFIFSLRTGSVKNLSDLFDGPSSLSSLISFFKSYDLKSFDVAWELIQSTTDFARLLKGLGTTLAKAGFGITSTLGDASRATSSTDFSGIFPFIDLLFLVPNGNPIYSPQLNLLQPGNELTFDYLEVNEGSVLEHLPLLNTDREKIVIGLSLQALIWKVNSEAVDLPHFPRSTVGQLEIQPYVEVCNMSDNEWSPLPQQTNPFYTLAKQSSTGKWMILVDPASLSNRIKLLMKNGFRGVGLYDYDMVRS